MTATESAGPIAHPLEPDNPLPSITLDDLPETLRQATTATGWTSLLPVQAYAIPYLLEGRDIMVQSQTGSGKTGAFVLPIIQRLDPRKRSCQALVLVPTRELAVQVAGEATKLGKFNDIHTVLVYGGVGYEAQERGFREGAHLIVGTPGRIIDHLIKGNLDVGNLEIMVFDEADRLMSMGFYPDMVQIRSYLPERRDSFMFSATFPPNVKALAEQFLQKPEFLSFSHDAVHVTQTDHIFYRIKPMDKDRALARIIDVENPDSGFIFCNTKSSVNYVTTVLQRFGYDADQISSDLTQQAREVVMNRVRKGTLRFLVATDVAARGIDVVHLSHVIQYDFPEDPESYIHRAGRTGRVGAEGVAIALVDSIEAIELRRAAKRFGIEMEERSVPTAEEVQTIVSQRVVALLEAKLRNRERLHNERMQRLVPLARSLLGEGEDEIALIAMLLDDFYHASLHAPATSPLVPNAPGPQASRKEKKKESRRRGGRRRRR